MATERNGRASPKLRFQSAVEFIDANPMLSEPIIDGLCRRGETVNVIGSTKEGKSWLILGMALSIAAGRDWLGRPVTQGRVALVDNELQAGTLSSRLRTVAHAMTVSEDVLQDEVEILSLRGRLCSIMDLAGAVDDLEGRDVALVGLDAFYRFLPEGVSENDNAQIAGVYNRIDHYATRLDATFILNHHSTKGDQNSKRVTDVGAGAGSISRAADTHLIIRPHEQSRLAVLDAACRSFARPDPQSLSWDFPLWSVSSEEPELRRQKSAGKANQESMDREADDIVRDVLKESGEEWLTRNRIKQRAGLGPGRVDRALRRIKDEIQEKQIPNPQNKKTKIDVFRGIEFEDVGSTEQTNPTHP